MAKKYDVIIVGGGINGAADLFELAQYTSLDRIALLEKYPTLASLNSNSKSNSQTLHRGDIETNIDFDKALKVQVNADMMSNYSKRYLGGEVRGTIQKVDKMVIGVGDDEVKFLYDRYDKFHKNDRFSDLELIDKNEIAKIEPKVTHYNGKMREEELSALYSKNGRVVNYGAVAESLVVNAKDTGKDIHVRTGTKVNYIRKLDDGFEVDTNLGLMTSDAVIVSAGAHSLMFAQQMGYGKQYGTLPVAGNFYWSKENVLNGKVYTVQNPKLPFAAIHGDPDINNGRTRFGPTALVLPVLERGNTSTFKDFLKTLNLGVDVIATLLKELGDSDVRNYMIRNTIGYNIPIIGKNLFLHDAQKIVPSLRYKDLEFAKGIGGIRPQVIDLKNRKLLKGEARIDEGDGAIFNMTPSPGATNALGNAKQDVKSIVKYLDAEFYEDKFLKELEGV